jgi:hypothetical protein
MQKSTNAYIKTVSKKSEIEGKEKILPIAHMGGTMVSHGEDFDTDSELGQCLSRKTAAHRQEASLIMQRSPRKNPRTSSQNTGKLCSCCDIELARVAGKVSGANEGVSGRSEEAGI